MEKSIKTESGDVDDSTLCRNVLKRDRESAQDVDTSEEATMEGKQYLQQTPIIKSQPNFVFASWLCSMVGQVKLRGGSGVIDIAGGNGLLSFELSCRYGELSSAYIYIVMLYKCSDVDIDIRIYLILYVLFWNLIENRYTVNCARPTTIEI